MVFACLGIAACLLWNCCLVAFHCLFPLFFFLFVFPFLFLGRWWVHGGLRRCFCCSVRAFGHSALLCWFCAGVCRCSVVPPASVGFRRLSCRLSCRLSSVFVGFRRLRRCYSARLCFLAGVPCFLAGVLLFLSASVGFPRCYSARHFGVIRLGISVFSGRGSRYFRPVFGVSTRLLLFFLQSRLSFCRLSAGVCRNSAGVSVILFGVCFFRRCLSRFPSVFISVF